MEKLKFIIFSIIALGLLVIVGYWAVVTLQSGTEYKASQQIRQLEKENEDLKKEMKRLKGELTAPQFTPTDPAPAEEEPKTPDTVVYKYQSLIDELQKLINDKIFLKLKSSGPRVGAIQKFLNIYNNTSNKVDNDYGENTKKLVSAFQKEQSLIADGEAGPGTFRKMIDWLKEQE